MPVSLRKVIKSRAFRYGLRVAISGGLLYWLFAELIPWDQVRALRIDSPAWLLAFVLTVNADRIVMAHKWNILLKGKQIDAPFGSIAANYYVTSMLGSFLPPTVGADALRTMYLRERIGRGADVVSSIMMERVLGLLSAVVVCLASSLLFAVYIDQRAWSLVGQVLLGLAVGSTLLLLSLGTSLLRFVPQKLRTSENVVVKKLRAVARSYMGYRDLKGVLVICFAWAVFEQLLQVGIPFMMSEVMGFDIPLLYFLAFVPVILVVSRLPISLDGFGVREGLYAYFFSLVAVPASQAALIGMLAHIARKVAVLPVVLYFLMARERVHPQDEAGGRT